MSEEEYSHRLSDEEKLKVIAQVDYFLSLISKRYNTSPDEILEAVRWVKERRDFAQKFKSSAMLTTLGIIMSALAMAVWEGLKAMVLRK